MNDPFELLVLFDHVGCLEDLGHFSFFVLGRERWFGFNETLGLLIEFKSLWNGCLNLF